MVRILQLALSIIFIASMGVNGQSMLKGSICGYNTDLLPQGINVVLIGNLNESIMPSAVTDSTGSFILDSVPNGKVDLQISFIGCYNTILADIELNNDTIEFLSIPIFEADCEIAWEGICEKKMLWGLIKRKEECGGTEYYKKSQFPGNNKIIIDCGISGRDSLVFELNPDTDNVIVDYKTFKICGNNIFTK